MVGLGWIYLDWVGLSWTKPFLIFEFRILTPKAFGVDWEEGAERRNCAPVLDRFFHVSFCRADEGNHGPSSLVGAVPFGSLTSPEVGYCDICCFMRAG